MRPLIKATIRFLPVALVLQEIFLAVIDPLFGLSIRPRNTRLQSRFLPYSDQAMVLRIRCKGLLRPAKHLVMASLRPQYAEVGANYILNSGSQ